MGGILWTLSDISHYLFSTAESTYPPNINIMAADGNKYWFSPSQVIPWTSGLLWAIFTLYLWWFVGFGCSRGGKLFIFCLSEPMSPLTMTINGYNTGLVLSPPISLMQNNIMIMSNWDAFEVVVCWILLLRWWNTPENWALSSWFPASCTAEHMAV